MIVVIIIRGLHGLASLACSECSGVLVFRSLPLFPIKLSSWLYYVVGIFNTTRFVWNANGKGNNRSNALIIILIINCFWLLVSASRKDAHASAIYFFGFDLRLEVIVLFATRQEQA